MPEYPYRKQGEREELSKKLMPSEARQPLKAGAKSPPRIVLAGKADFASSGRLFTEGPDMRPPKWLRKALKDNLTHEKVLDLVERRLEGRVSEQRLQEAMAIVNEIARRRNGTKLVHKYMTQDRIDDLIKKGR